MPLVENEKEVKVEVIDRATEKTSTEKMIDIQREQGIKPYSICLSCRTNYAVIQKLVNGRKRSYCKGCLERIKTREGGVVFRLSSEKTKQEIELSRLADVRERCRKHYR